jgi:hypothetical protein
MGKYLMSKRGISLVAKFLFLGLALIVSANMASAKSAKEASQGRQGVFEKRQGGSGLS